MTQESHPDSSGQSEHPLAGMKVVLNILEDGVLIGISRGAVDPYIENCAISPNDGIQDILATVPEALERAQARWAGQPRFPAAQPPPAAPAAPRAGPPTIRGRPGTGGQTEPGVRRPRMF